MIFTAAFPGQQGIGHINCQPKEYWLEKFTNIGLTRNTKAEDNWEKTMSKERHMGWFKINKLIFTK